jgi:hypothetical protein
LDGVDGEVDDEEILGFSGTMKHNFSDFSDFWTFVIHSNFLGFFFFFFKKKKKMFMGFNFLHFEIIVLILFIFSSIWCAESNPLLDWRIVSIIPLFWYSIFIVTFLPLFW